ncbi:MAG: HU family DNA-binding protein [Candidatus Marinimicrobia bacterium]|nr:HU family DNA-binding protein [Candidatus Neomarinimicrobiota bacterium]
MTKADIINTVSRATGLTKIETEAVMEGIFATIKLSLKRII